MKKRFLLFSSIALSILSLSVLFITGCQREIDTPGGGTTTSGVDDNIMVTGGMRGTVVDENNQPVSGATVTSGSSTTTTDRYGVFRFNNISLSKANAYVKVVKQGYFLGTRTFPATAGRIHNVRIRLLPKTTAGTFTASAGGTITIAGGGKLVMPANSVTDASGNTYTGAVNVAMVWIDPTASNLPEIVPGDLRGVTTSGQERGLETYGMLGVEMTSPGGQVLKIASGKTAELTFPVPAAIAGTAPTTIDLWHFDEATGRWKQEGTATKTGSNYIAQVSHFSFWNCDAPFPLINLCMTLVNAANTQPLNNVQVRIKRANGSYGYGWTDSTGSLCGKVPKDEPLVLQVLDQCHSVVFTQNIGPFGADASLGTISVTIPPANSLIITGMLVNCAGANITNGAVAVQTSGSYNYPLVVNNGTFSLTILRCSSAPVSFTVMGINYATGQVSVPVSGTGTTGTVNVGTIQACSAADVFMEFTVDGTPFSYTNFPPNQIYVSDSSAIGTYPTRTGIYGQNVSNGTNAVTSYFAFFNNTTPGVFPMDNATWATKITDGANILLKEIVTPNPTVTITTFGPPATGYIEGSFNLQMRQDPSSPVRNVTCNFKVKRQ